MEYVFTTAAYVVAAVLFIPRSAPVGTGKRQTRRLVRHRRHGAGHRRHHRRPRRGNWLLSAILIIGGGAIGCVCRQRVQMTEMPQLVAAMHSLVGLAAVFIGLNAHLELARVSGMDEAARSALTGFAALLAHKGPAKLPSCASNSSRHLHRAVTFTGSVVAFLKLSGGVTFGGKTYSVPTTATKLPGGHMLNAAAALLSVVLLVWSCVYFNTGSILAVLLMTAAALFIGYHLIMGIGGADMPVVVSMLNSYSGWAAAAIGFSLSNDLLIVVGALVGSSGAILSYIMCKAMNRSFISVILAVSAPRRPRHGNRR